MPCQNKKITVEAVARRYGVHPNTLRRWNADRKLGFPRPIRLRGILFYELADLVRLIPLTQVRLYAVGSAVAGIVPFYDVPIARGLVVGCESQQCFE